MLANVLSGLNADNFAIIMNKCNEDDEKKDIINFYNEARKQGELKLPDLTDDQILIFERQTGIINKAMAGE